MNVLYLEFVVNAQSGTKESLVRTNIIMLSYLDFTFTVEYFPGLCFL